MKLITNASIICLNRGECALVFKENSVEAHTQRCLDIEGESTSPEQMLAIVASIMGKTNRDLFEELKSRADEAIHKEK